MTIVQNLVDCCYERGLVDEKHIPALRYYLEKRISNLLTAIPFFAAGLLISTPKTAISFFLGFCVLRKRTSGCHAKTWQGCLLASLIAILFFLGVLGKFLPPVAMYTALTISIAIVFFLAPFNHPKLHLSDKEIQYCAVESKIRLAILSLAIILAVVFKEEQIASGGALSIILTATSLVLAYYQKWRDEHEKTRNRNPQSA